MVRIRLRRVGAKKQPAYRIVVADKRAPRDGRFIETIGHYNPRTDPPKVTIFEDRALHWLSVGARPSEPVRRFFDRLGLGEKLKKIHAGAEIEDVAAPRLVAANEPAAVTEVEAVQADETPAPEAVAEKVEEAKEATSEVADDAAEATAEVVEEVEEAAEEATETVAERASEAADDAAEATAEVVEEVKEAAEEAVETVTETADRLADGALDLSTRVANSLQDAGVETVQALRELYDEGEEKLLEISGIGAKAVDEIREKLQGQDA